MKKMMMFALTLLFCASAFAQVKKPLHVKAKATGPHNVALSCTPAAGTSPTGFNFFRGSTAGGESATPINSSPVSTCAYTDLAVTPGTTYYYTATEIVGGVSSGYSNEVFGTIPVFPVTGTTLVITGTNGVVDWSPSADSSSAYYIYSGTTSGGESSTPVNSSPVAGGCATTATCTYTIANLTPGATYYVTVKAVINGVLSVAGNEASATAGVPAPGGLKMTTN